MDAISPESAKVVYDRGEVLFVDVREPMEFAGQRIPSARLVPLGQLEKESRTWKKDQPIILYCQSGKRGIQAQMLLKTFGFSQVSNLTGGIAAWATSGLPTEKSAEAPWSIERQVRFTVGVFVISFTSLGLWVHPAFFLLNFLIAGGLIFSAITDTCGMALILARLPWNQVKLP